MQVLKSSSLDFLSPLILQKMKEDNVSQLGDYDMPFCEQQYMLVSCYISLFKFKSFDQFREGPVFFYWAGYFFCKKNCSQVVVGWKKLSAKQREIFWNTLIFQNILTQIELQLWT